jgi:hypothetical protein
VKRTVKKTVKRTVKRTAGRTAERTEGETTVTAATVARLEVKKRRGTVLIVVLLYTEVCAQ